MRSLTGSGKISFEGRMIRATNKSTSGEDIIPRGKDLILERGVLGAKI